MKLSPEQISEVQRELVRDGLPVRFLVNGQALNIVTGELASRGSNVMYHPVYWSFSRETSRKVAAWLGARPVFDEEGE